MLRLTTAVFLCAIAFCFPMLRPATAQAEDAKVAVEKHEGGAKVTVGDKLFADYLIKTGPKPIVWPIIGPGGQEMSRNYPMKLVAGEKRDHPHQRSLWFTHGSLSSTLGS